MFLDVQQRCKVPAWKYDIKGGHGGNVLQKQISRDLSEFNHMKKDNTHVCICVETRHWSNDDDDCFYYLKTSSLVFWLSLHVARSFRFYVHIFCCFAFSEEKTCWRKLKKKLVQISSHLPAYIYTCVHCTVQTALTAKKCTYTRTSTPVRRCNNLFTMETRHCEQSWNLKLRSDRRQAKSIQSNHNHDDALAKRNVQRSAC